MAAESPGGVGKFCSSLEDLVENSKPLITKLTRSADKNKNHAREIIGVIKEQITKSPGNQKLLMMYLIDSIIKEVGDCYLRGFSKSIIKTFCYTFEWVDEKTQKKLHELRLT